MVRKPLLIKPPKVGIRSYPSGGKLIWNISRSKLLVVSGRSSRYDSTMQHDLLSGWFGTQVQAFRLVLPVRLLHRVPPGRTRKSDANSDVESDVDGKIVHVSSRKVASPMPYPLAHRDLARWDDTLLTHICMGNPNNQRRERQYWEKLLSGDPMTRDSPKLRFRRTCSLLMC